MPVNHATILVLETDAAINLALSRVNFGPNISFQFAPPDYLPTPDDPPFAAIIGDDTLFTGGTDLPPFELLRQVVSTPIILLTSSTSPRFIQAAKEAGAAAVIKKPFGISELRKVLASALQNDLSNQLLTTPEQSKQLLNSSAASEPTDSTSAVSALAPVGEHLAPDQIFDQLFSELERRQPLEEGLDAFDVVERHLIRRALSACNGNQSQAARFLGITRNTLRKRIRKYDFGSILIKDDEPEAD